MKLDTAQRSAHLLSFALEHPWAITAGMLATIADLLARHLTGAPSDPAAIAAALVARSNRVPAPYGTPRGGGTIAVIPIFGVVAPRMNLLSETSGGTSFETLTSQLRAAVADPRVTQIVFDVDSPGGSTAGATEFAREVRDAAATKPVLAHAQHLMASAAYWAMSGATAIIASPSALVGSIGVFTIHEDLSRALEQLGVKRTIISAGKYKADGVAGTALSPEARTHVQQVVDSAYGRFVTDVASGRRVPVATVRNGFGEGRLLDADLALRAGLITRIATRDDVLGALDGTAAAASMAAHRQALARAQVAFHRHTLEATARRSH